jgi:predicted dehydrogenase
MQTTKIGIVGCGNISGVYFSGAQKLQILETVACADIALDRAKAKAEEFGVPKACTPDELLADPEVEIVVNLTIPKVHGTIGLAALEAGKSVYNEKPLAPTREEAQKMLAIAEAKGLRIGGAPDTFLGAGLQTCRKLIDDGWIGEPIGASAFMLGHGPEGFHPEPDFFYQPGGGPMFDMGPYYLTTLVNLLGPVSRVAGKARITFPERVIVSQPHFGEIIKVNTPTHITGILEFASGAVGTLTTSFDVWATQLPCIEIYGSEGSLSCPDPNTFGGPVRVRRAGASDWSDVPLSHCYADQFRGLGVADMAAAMRSGRPHRANGKLAYHVLDLMHAFHDASREGKYIDLSSGSERPAPMPMTLAPGAVEE